MTPQIIILLKLIKFLYLLIEHEKNALNLEFNYKKLILNTEFYQLTGRNCLQFLLYVYFIFVNSVNLHKEIWFL